MSVLDSVREQLAGDASWRAQTALALAGQVDETGSASAARELRAVMTDIASAKAIEPTGDAVDEVRRRREARHSARRAAT